jgi:large subunit ribosomal protein L13
MNQGGGAQAVRRACSNSAKMRSKGVWNRGSEGSVFMKTVAFLPNSACVRLGVSVILPPFRPVCTLNSGLADSTDMKTFSAKNEEVKRDWYLIDANGKTLGRLASEIARRLKGKHKPEYTPHVDTGDYIVVVNAGKVTVTGNKMKDKVYHQHTGYMGNLKSITFEKLRAKKPERVIEIAVKGMLPKNPLGRAMFRKLKVYAGAEHQHAAQQPKPLEI